MLDAQVRQTLSIIRVRHIFFLHPPCFPELIPRSPPRALSLSILLWVVVPIIFTVVFSDSGAAWGRVVSQMAGNDPAAMVKGVFGSLVGDGNVVQRTVTAAALVACAVLSWVLQEAMRCLAYVMWRDGALRRAAPHRRPKQHDGQQTYCM